MGAGVGMWGYVDVWLGGVIRWAPWARWARWARRGLLGEWAFWVSGLDWGEGERVRQWIGHGRWGEEGGSIGGKVPWVGRKREMYTGGFQIGTQRGVQGGEDPNATPDECHDSIIVRKPKHQN